jgi:uncharacterized membrane protein
MIVRFFFAALTVLSAAGFALSLYFALVYHRIVGPGSNLLPRFCRMDEQSCGTLLNTKEASLFGLPNFYLGLVYYSVLLVVPLIFERQFWNWWHYFAAASVLAVGMGIYLSYSLIVRLKINCVLCFAGHAINLLIAGLMFAVV